MTRVLILSSWVAFGHVGLSAATPVLQILGHDVTQLPTTVLSNHPGWPHVSGSHVPASQIGMMLDALEENGWLSDHDVFLCGYLPTAEHVATAVNLVRRLRALPRPPKVVIDPILGDEPKGLYVPEAVAIAVRDRLVPLADILTPNAFELGWLRGGGAETFGEVVQGAERLSARAQSVIVTSVPVSADRIGVLSAGSSGMRLWTTPRRADVPHGVGDAFSALIAAGMSVGSALGHLSTLIEASIGAQHLRIVETAPAWTCAGAVSPVSFPATEET